MDEINPAQSAPEVIYVAFADGYRNNARGEPELVGVMHDITYQDEILSLTGETTRHLGLYVYVGHLNVGEHTVDVRTSRGTPIFSANVVVEPEHNGRALFHLEGAFPIQFVPDELRHDRPFGDNTFQVWLDECPIGITRLETIFLGRWHP